MTVTKSSIISKKSANDISKPVKPTNLTKSTKLTKPTKPAKPTKLTKATRSSGSKTSRSATAANHKYKTTSTTDSIPVVSEPKMINRLLCMANNKLTDSEKNPVVYDEAALINPESNKAAVDAYYEAKAFLKNNNISVSTITLDCKLRTLVDVDKFAAHVVLKEDGIVSVKFGNRKDIATNRTIVVIKNKKKPSLKNFFNQVTILMKPMNNPEHNYINIKVFKNGSLQMTGCKDMEDFTNVTRTLVKILKKGYDMKMRNGKIRHYSYIKSPGSIGIYDTKVRMINSNFKLNYKVDREKLAKILVQYHGENTKDKEIGYVEHRYKPTNGHSCVNIKLRYNEENKPSIFVFQTGAIIITGAKNLQQIIQAYHYIHKILAKYYNAVRIIELNPKLVQAEIARYYRSNKLNLQCI